MYSFCLCLIDVSKLQLIQGFNLNLRSFRDSFLKGACRSIAFLMTLIKPVKTSLEL